MSQARYATRLATTKDDLRAAQQLRYRAFIAGTGAAPRDDGREADAFDADCRHVLVEDTATVVGVEPVESSPEEHPAAIRSANSGAMTVTLMTGTSLFVVAGFRCTQSADRDAPRSPGGETPP